MVGRAGGEGGIRTPDTVARIPHFECGAIDHSATSPWSQGQTSPVGGRYVSNAAGRNKGGAPIEIDEVIGERPPGGVICRREAGSPYARPVHRMRRPHHDRPPRHRDPGATRQNRWTVETAVVSPLGPGKSGLPDLRRLTADLGKPEIGCLASLARDTGTAPDSRGKASCEEDGPAGQAP
jgi:hypothetical protein